MAPVTGRLRSRRGFFVPPADTLEECFWLRVDRGDGCWLWTGSTTRAGYGCLTFRQRHYYAHRLAWSLANGEAVPQGHYICHRCDNPPCVRPEHLFLGTPTENALDCIRKGRARRVPVRGERNLKAKLTEVMVCEARTRVMQGERKVDLAREYGVSQSALGEAVNGRTWGHVR